MVLHRQLKWTVAALMLTMEMVVVVVAALVVKAKCPVLKTNPDLVFSNFLFCIQQYFRNPHSNPIQSKAEQKNCSTINGQHIWLQDLRQKWWSGGLRYILLELFFLVPSAMRRQRLLGGYRLEKSSGFWQNWDCHQMQINLLLLKWEMESIHSVLWKDNSGRVPAASITPVPARISTLTIAIAMTMTMTLNPTTSNF